MRSCPECGLRLNLNLDLDVTPREPDRKVLVLAGDQRSC